MRRVLYDTNVLLDVILGREPHLAASAAALESVAAGKVEGYVAGHAVTTIAYLVQRERGAVETRRTLAHLLSRLRVAAVTDSSVRLALNMAFADFEDAICAASAQEATCDLIVTRNPQHFLKSQPPALLPEAFLSLPPDTDSPSESKGKPRHRS